MNTKQEQLLVSLQLSRSNEIVIPIQQNSWNAFLAPVQAFSLAMKREKALSMKKKFGRLVHFNSMEKR